MYRVLGADGLGIRLKFFYLRRLLLALCRINNRRRCTKSLDKAHRLTKTIELYQLHDAAFLCLFLSAQIFGFFYSINAMHFFYIGISISQLAKSSHQ
jgi:hypothetical protein